MPNTIILKGNPPRFEGAAAAIITPGYLLDYDGSGDLILHAGSAAFAQKMIAVEEDFMGEEITETYASGDRVQYVIGRPGDVLYLMLADNETVAIGDPLGSKGDGTLAELTIDATVVEGALVAYAEEAVTTSGAIARIRVRIA